MKSSAKDEEKPLGKKSMGDLQGVSGGDAQLTYRQFIHTFTYIHAYM